MRSILVYADRRAGMDARLETALSLAKAANGHVTVLVDTPVARYVALDPMGGSYVASDALKQAMADDDSNASRIEARLQSEGIPFDILRSEAEPVEALAKAAQLADIVVISRSGGLAGELALLARTPILAMSDETALAFPLDSVCIAWDGGFEAALALRGAVPLLGKDTRVEVLTVKEKAGGFPADDALRYLARHGVDAKLQELQRRGSTEETLAVAVAGTAAKLLVMGAFGHSRIREYLFGGVTRYFLDEDRGPSLFLVH